jgi:O-antigen ligase
MIKKHLYPFLLSGKPLRWSTYTIAILPVAPRIISSIAMITWASLILLYNFAHLAKRTPGKTHQKKIFFLLAGNFLLFILSLLYTENIPEGLSFLQTSLPMLAFPFFIFFVPYTIDRDEKLLTTVVQVFWACSLLVTIYIFYRFFELGYMSEFSKASRFNGFYRESAEVYTGKHAMYLSMYLAFAIYIAIEQLQKKTTRLLKTLYIISIPVLFAMLLLLASRGPLVGMILGFMVILFLQVKNIRRRILFSLGFIIIVLLAVRFTPAIYSRVLELSDTALEPPVGVHHNSVNIRVGILKCTWQIIQQNPLIGIGAGDDKKMLTACYETLPTDAYTKQFYNTHNQYANFFLLTGVVALLLFLFSIVYTFIIAITRRNHALLFFIILMTVTFFIENILSREAGVTFYYYFLCLLLYFAISPAAKSRLNSTN